MAADQTPRSARDQTAGMAYFPRMLDKIRLHAAGRLRADFHANLGKGADARCLSYLRVSYADLQARVAQGGTDEEILAWCQEKGRVLSEEDLVVWNGFIIKLGWNDAVSPRLKKLKEENGLGERNDILTMPDFFDVDEGRKP